jgi:hypothetical protein
MTTSLGATKGDVKLFAPNGAILMDLSGTDPSVEHVYQMDPIVYPLPREDSGSFDIAMYVDDTITITGDLAYNSTSNVWGAYVGMYHYCKYPTYTGNQAHVYIIWNTTGYWSIPKTINFSQDAGKGDMMTYKFVFLRCGKPDYATDLGP